jgi:Ser/Thr protein kinase RdoA (MazF antagonist)
MKFSEILKFIQKEYDKDFHLIKKFEDGFRNSVYKLKDKNSHYLLVVYKREKGIKERIENIHKVSGKLSETDFNVEIRIPLLTKEEEDFVFISEIKRYAAVYNFIDGKNIPWEEYKRRHLKGMGKVLSNFHYYLRSYDSSSLPKWKDLLLTEFDEMVGYFKKVEPWILKKLRVKAENLKVNE